MKEIGGYYELELPKSNGYFIHSGCVMVNSGRHALEYILRSLGSLVEKVFIPYYTCDVILQTILKLKLGYDFYNLNSNLEISSDFHLKDGEYIIINNYFGIKDEYVNRMATKYKGHIIIDNAQAWYADEILGFNIFYSPRKFFGLPDGGCAFATHQINDVLTKDCSFERCSHLIKRIDIDAGSGYNDFRNNSKLIKDESLKEMSKFTHRLLSSIDFEQTKNIRRTNYRILDDALKSTNLLSMPNLNQFACPMVYPYLVKDGEFLRKKLIDNNIFVATYWPNVLKWCDASTVEYQFAQNMLPLPIDQRYDYKDMERIISVIKAF